MASTFTEAIQNIRNIQNNLIAIKISVTLRVADLADPKSIRTRDLTPPPILLNR